MRHSPLGQELELPLRVPQPVPGMATRKVLVMDYIEGTPLSKLEEKAKERGRCGRRSKGLAFELS